jgi:hypothetical protein
MAAEVPPLPDWEKISEAHDWLSHAQACRDRWAFLYLDCKLHQVPDGNFYRYGQEILDLAVDGIIADREDALCQVLEEEPYRQFCRKALPADWDPFHAFGIGIGIGG